MDSRWKARILVVEDDPSMVTLLTALLEFGGYHVRSAGSVESALQAFAQLPADLVLLDIRLPDATGYELAKNLRHQEHRWDLPILMLSGMDRPIDQLRGFAYGADAYLTKPCDPDELLSTVNFLLETKVV